MRIILGELKKIWTLKIIGIIVAISVVFFLLFMRTWVTQYPRGTWFSTVDWAHHLTELYGATLEREDFYEFLRYREALVAELDAAIATNAVFAYAGISNYAEYEAFVYDFSMRHESLTAEERNLLYAVLDQWFTVDGQLIWEGAIRIDRMTIPSHHRLGLAFSGLQSFDLIIAMYTSGVLRESGMAQIDMIMQPSINIADGTIIQRHNQRQIRRLEEIRDSGELASIIDGEVVHYTAEYGARLAMLVILATLILVAPLIVTDRASKVHWLQYASRQGRGIFARQFAAVLISAVGIATIFIAIFAGVFSVNGTWVFWNSGINSFMGIRYYWLSITYGQYVLLMVGIIYLLSLAAAAFTFVLSRFSQHMVRLVFKLVPFLVAALIFTNWVLGHFLNVSNGGDAATQALMLIALCVVGLLLSAIVVRTEKWIELK